MLFEADKKQILNGRRKRILLERDLRKQREREVDVHDWVDLAELCRSGSDSRLEQILGDRDGTCYRTSLDQVADMFRSFAAEEYKIDAAISAAKLVRLHLDSPARHLKRCCRAYVVQSNGKFVRVV